MAAAVRLALTIILYRRHSARACDCCEMSFLLSELGMNNKVSARAEKSVSARVVLRIYQLKLNATFRFIKFSLLGAEFISASR
jgi:hypothetical protein